ncbi:distal membrane-arm assembly complex protein 1 [Tachyglossus aculeatus]|uniref:distal membrane-arm assembly complex protein 1 n=1 Tax=Tachyglossus aculeatus TaxID=9261 RepID=UPI0018F5A09C|nr:distal membrane-arm assembly complex protein 1 [Tachyglossus aculeatus]
MAAASSSPSSSSSPPSPVRTPLMGNCWSCRLLSGTGLLGAGGYVYWAGRRPMKLGIPPGPGHIAQMVLGIGIGCWGVVVMTDPAGTAWPKK